MTHISQCMFLHFTMHLLILLFFSDTKTRNFPTELFRLPATDDDDLHFMDVSSGNRNSDYRTRELPKKKFMLISRRHRNLHDLMNFDDAGGGDRSRKSFQVRLMHLTLIVQSISDFATHF